MERQHFISDVASIPLISALCHTYVPSYGWRMVRLHVANVSSYYDDKLPILQYVAAVTVYHRRRVIRVQDVRNIVEFVVASQIAV